MGNIEVAAGTKSTSRVLVNVKFEFSDCIYPTFMVLKYFLDNLQSILML